MLYSLHSCLLIELGNSTLLNQVAFDSVITFYPTLFHFIISQMPPYDVFRDD